MRCIDKYIKTAALCLTIVITFSACGVISQFTQEEDVVAAYEIEQYNDSLYMSSLAAETLCVASDNVEMSNGPATSSLSAAALFDLNGQKVDYGYQIHDKVYPASITKIMTALVALKKVEDLSVVVTVPSDADVSNFAADEKTCGIKTGDQITMEDLLYGLLVYSGNDNAVAIADYVGGSVEGFSDMMNEEAKSLLATNTHFVNPNGLHSEEHYTTAYDLYLIFNECIKQDKFLEIINTDEYTSHITGADGSSRDLKWEQTNFYATGEAALPENADIIGGKTGTTTPAGNCLILLEEDSEKNPYISLVMGADTKALLYQDMTTLIDSISD